MVESWLFWLGAAAATAGVGLVARMSYEARLHHVELTDVYLDRLPLAFAGSQIFFISDIHRRELRPELIRDLKGKVDWVIIGGDMMERNVPLNRVEQNMKLLCSIAPVYAVYGNHDYKAVPEELEMLLQRCGVVLLKDENTTLERSGQHIWLTGVDYPRYIQGDYRPLPPLPKEAEKECRILVVHDPAWIQKFLVKPADLILAGHTHGGQITLPFFGPVRMNAFYRRYASGWFEWRQPGALVKTSRMLISRGFGTRRIPFRLCCPAEMHLLKLRSVQA